MKPLLTPKTKLSSRMNQPQLRQKIYLKNKVTIISTMCKTVLLAKFFFTPPRVSLLHLWHHALHPHLFVTLIYTAGFIGSKISKLKHVTVFFLNKFLIFLKIFRKMNRCVLPSRVYQVSSRALSCSSNFCWRPKVGRYSPSKWSTMDSLAEDVQHS